MWGITEEMEKKIASEVAWKHRYQAKKRNRPRPNEMLRSDYEELEVCLCGVWVSSQHENIYDLRNKKCRIAISRMWKNQQGKICQSLAYQYSRKALMEFVKDYNNNNFFQLPEFKGLK